LLTLADRRILPLLLPVLLFAGTLNTAGASLIVRQMRLSPPNTIGLGSICAALIKHLPGLISTSIRSSLAVLSGMLKLVIPGLRAYRDHSLYAPVVIMEEKQGGEALSRSKSLVEKLRYPITAIQLH